MTNDLSGKIIRGYHIGNIIGSGGFGVVYKAHQPIIERDVAIKIIHAKYANQLDFTRRFELEARLIARLESQYIVPIYDFWRDSTGAYMVMRWLRGNNLRSLLNQNPRPSMEMVVRILFQLVSALTVAHQQNVVHRDIKPENVLFDEHQNVYLTDFGIAVDIMHMPNEITLKALSLGSPMYMAPEQLTRQTTSPQADVYSLGILLYEMLAGKAPFSGGVTEIIQQKRMSLPIASLLTLRQDLPPALDGVLWQATAQSPIARYNSVVELFNAFIKVVAVKSDFSMLGWLSASQKISPSQFVSKSDTIQLDGGGTLILNQPPDQASAVEWINNDTQPLQTAIRNPFKGLRPFDELDARDFFGRKEAISRLSDFFADPQNRFLAVVGPSGSGKSSLVRAGLLAMVRQQSIPQSKNWVIATMSPTDDPFTALHEALSQVTMTTTIADLSDLHDSPQVLHHHLNQILPTDIELFLFIDQFEEIFTQSTDAPIAHDFLDMLHHSLTHPQSRLRLILTLRADYYDRPLQHQHFGELIREHTEVVLPLSDLALEEIIIEPSLQVGLAVQPELKIMILQDLSGQQGALPLLQYTLSELYENRDGSNRLSLATYRALGGISGALSRRAEAIFADLTPSEQATAQQLFLRCVTVEGGGVPTRKRVLMTSLLANLPAQGRDRLVAVTEKFTRWRLLTLDRDPVTRSPTIDIAHEALIGAWSRLAGWIEENRGNLRRYYQLQMLTQAWHESGKDVSFLAVGVRLSEFEDLLTSPFITLSHDESTFIASSMALKQRKENRARLGVISLAAVAIFMTILAIFAVAQGQLALQSQAQALIERDRANTSAQIARSRELAANSVSALNRLDVALLLGYYATTIADTVEARNSLLTALQAAPNISTFLHGQEGDVRAVIYSPDGAHAISAGETRVIRVWDTTTWKLHYHLTSTHTDTVTGLAIFGETLFSAGADGAIYAYDMTRLFTLKPINFAPQPNPIWALASHPNEAIIVSGAEDGTLTVWDATTGTILHQLALAHDGAIYALAFSPDGSILASGGADNRVRFWDAKTGESLADTPAWHTNWVSALAFSPTGTQLASSGADSTLILWDMATLSPAQTVTLDEDVWVRGMTYNTTGEMLALAGLDGRLRIWDAVSNQFLGDAYTGHMAGIWDVAPSQAGDGFITGGADGLVIVWDFTPPYRMATRAFVIGRDVMSMAYHPSGAMLAIGANNGLVQLWDTEAGQLQTRLTGHEVAVMAMAYAPSGDYLVTFDIENRLIVWRVSDMSIRYDAIIAGAVITPDIAFSADETAIFVAGEDAMLRVGIDDGQIVTIPTQINAISAFELSTDGDILAVGGSSGNIQLLSLPDMRLQAFLSGHTDTITALAFARGRGVLVSASRDNQLMVWDLQTNQPLYEPLRAHADWVLDVSISPDERLMASVGRDQTVILWDMTTARPLGLPFLGHRGWAKRVLFSADGARVYSAGADGAIFEWMVGLDDWQVLACNISNRVFANDEWGRYFESKPPAPCEE